MATMIFSTLHYLMRHLFFFFFLLNMANNSRNNIYYFCPDNRTDLIFDLFFFFKTQKWELTDQMTFFFFLFLKMRTRGEIEERIINKKKIFFRK